MIRITPTGGSMADIIQRGGRNAAKAVSIAMAGMAEGAKQDLRRAVSAYAGAFGKGRMGRVANAIRAESYPRPPKYSPAAAAAVFAQGEQAERIFSAFSTGPLVTPNSGRPTFTGKGKPTLAIPLHQYRDINGHLLGPRSSFFSGRLVFVPAKQRTGQSIGVLAMPGVGRPSAVRRQRNTVNRQALSKTIDKQMVPMFALVRAVRHPKVIDPDAVASKWAAAGPALAEQAMANLQRGSA